MRWRLPDLTALLHGVWKEKPTPLSWVWSAIELISRGEHSDCINYLEIRLLPIDAEVSASILLRRLTAVLGTKVRKHQTGRGCIGWHFTRRQIIEIRHTPSHFSNSFLPPETHPWLRRLNDAFQWPSSEGNATEAHEFIALAYFWSRNGLCLFIKFTRNDYRCSIAAFFLIILVKTRRFWGNGDRFSRSSEYGRQAVEKLIKIAPGTLCACLNVRKIDVYMIPLGLGGTTASEVLSLCIELWVLFEIILIHLSRPCWLGNVFCIKITRLSSWPVFRSYFDFGEVTWMPSDEVSGAEEKMYSKLRRTRCINSPLLGSEWPPNQ